MPIWIPIPFLFITLILLLRAEAQTPKDERQIKLWKPLSTLLVILVCGLSFTRPADAHDPAYTLLILAGLAFSMAGDVLLIFQANPRAFLGGLVAFLIAHLFYIGAFIYLQLLLGLRGNLAGEMIVGLGLGIVGGLVYRYLRPGLGKMGLPVIVYIVVISVMVHRTLAIALAYSGPRTQPALLVAGALLFYLSDAILAINRFRLGGQMSHYRVWNLSTYYAGQLLIALSASFVA